MASGFSQFNNFAYSSVLGPSQVLTKLDCLIAFKARQRPVENRVQFENDVVQLSTRVLLLD